MKNAQQTESKAVVGKVDRRVFSNPKKLLLRIFIGIIILLLAYMGWSQGKKYYQNKTNAVVCSEAILKEAAPVLERSKKEQLKPVAAKIQQLQKFDKDPNCLYVVVTYFVNIDDPKSARLHLDKLTKVYNSKKGFNPILTKNGKDLAALKAEVEFLEKTSAAAEKNIITVPNQP